MRRIAVLSMALAVAVLVWADSSQAQDDQGQGGRRGRAGQGQGRQGRGGGFGQRGGGRNSLEGLLQMDEVKTEIDLTEDQGSEISEYADGLERPNFQDFGNFQDMTAEERTEAMAKFGEANAKRAAEIRTKVEAVLLEPQMTRLNEIYVQALGINGLSDAWIAGQLELSDDQKAKLAEMAPAFGGRGGRRGGGDQGGQSREEREAAMMDVLTTEQKTKYETMKGTDEFEFPQRGRGGRGGAGGGGRRGGGGGGGAGGGGGGGI